MAGKKGRSGRKKSPRNVMRYLTECIEDNAYELAKALVDKALDGDRESLVYCFDRIGGKPQQSTNLDITGGEALTASLVVSLFAMLAAKRKELELESRQVIQIEKTGSGGVVE